MNPMKWFVLLLALILNGCASTLTTKEVMNSWTGAHVSRLIRSWGPPQQVTTDGLDGHVYIWRKDVNIPLTQASSETTRTIDYNPYSGQYAVKSETTYAAPIIIEGQKLRMFWVNKDGIIYHWQARGFTRSEKDDVLIAVTLVMLATTGLLYILSAFGYGSM